MSNFIHNKLFDNFPKVTLIDCSISYDIKNQRKYFGSILQERTTKVLIYGFLALNGNEPYCLDS